MKIKKKIVISVSVIILILTISIISIYKLIENDVTNRENLKVGIQDKKPGPVDTVNNNKNSQSYSKVIEHIKIELSIPKDWNYEELAKDEENDTYKYALKLYKENNNQYAVIYLYNNQFGVCGTGRTSENIILNNGKEAAIGYYDGNSNWSDISFYDNKNIVIINYDLTNKDAKEAIEFIKTINLTEDNENEECCDGCMCGDTIKLLKTTETAWTLTKIDNKGEYEYIKDAFINFHGTGKDKFAFFKNDKEIKGKFTINKSNEIILIPNDNKIKKITCKLGEEKNLIAVMHCDNNFGIFTLQKQGTLELPSIIKDTVSKTKTIKIKGHQSITEEKEINAFLSVINNSKIWTGAVNLPSPKYELELLDVNNNRIAKILYNPGHYFSIEINKKNYELTNIDKNSLNIILDK